MKRICLILATIALVANFTLVTDADAVPVKRSVLAPGEHVQMKTFASVEDDRPARLTPTLQWLVRISRLLGSTPNRDIDFATRLSRIVGERP